MIINSPVVKYWIDNTILAGVRRTRWNTGSRLCAINSKPKIKPITLTMVGKRLFISRLLSHE